MDTKTLIISESTALFQQKGYIGVGVNEILKMCNISKGAFYHHFPNGKEELLISCLQSLNEAITLDIEHIFSIHHSTQSATRAMLEKLISNFENEGTITTYTSSSIVSEMALLSDSVRNACSQLYEKMQGIYITKLRSDGYPLERATAVALLLTAMIEGAIMLCLTQKSSHPLKVIVNELPTFIKE